MEIKAETADKLFDEVCRYLSMKKYRTNPETTNGCSAELVNANLVLVDPTRNTMCECKRKMSMRYAIAELMWYESRMATVKSIEPYSKFWRRISDDGVCVNSNYGWCIHDKYHFDQWEYAKAALLKDRSSRQAIIHIKEPRDLVMHPSKDVNCTLSLQFLIRKNKLDLIVTMRSNDVWLGLPYDVFNFTCMQMKMAMELNIEVGTYYHNAGSLHLYQRDEEKIKEVK